MEADIGEAVTRLHAAAAAVDAAAHRPGARIEGLLLQRAALVKEIEELGTTAPALPNQGHKTVRRDTLAKARSIARGAAPST